MFSFSEALNELKAGSKVAGAGWNGKGMWIYLVPANSYPAQTIAAKEYWRGKSPQPANVSEDPQLRPVMVPYGAYIAMKTAQENVVPWLASQTDVLTDDWSVVL